MEITYHGGNCVRINSKQASIVIDDNLEEMGLKDQVKAGDIAIYTAAHGIPKEEAKLVIDQPGEYEVSDTSIRGLAARAHIDDEEGHTATMYKLICQDVRIGVVGHIYPELSEDQLEALGTIDILIIPVGGNGYTLDAIGASKVIRNIGPKIVIPTHYNDKAINYPVPQQELEEAIKNMSMEPSETVQKLKIKPNDIAENTQLIVIERS